MTLGSAEAVLAPSILRLRTALVPVPQDRSEIVGVEFEMLGIGAVAVEHGGNPGLRGVRGVMRPYRSWSGRRRSAHWRCWWTPVGFSHR